MSDLSKSCSGRPPNAAIWSFEALNKFPPSNTLLTYLVDSKNHNSPSLYALKIPPLRLTPDSLRRKHVQRGLSCAAEARPLWQDISGA